jgi:hypothetical protein
MISYLLYGELLAEIMDMLGQPFGDTLVGLKELQIFSPNTAAGTTPEPAKARQDSYPRFTEVQITDRSASPAVDPSAPTTTYMAHGDKPSIRCSPQQCFPTRDEDIL